MAKSFIAALAGLLGMTAAACADIIWGVNGHPINSYPGVTIARQLDYVKDLGMKSYRVNISDVAGGSKLAVVVEEAKARGIDVLPVITPGNIDLKVDSAEVLYAKARELAIALGSRFKKDIRVWELGNELENHAIIERCEMRDDGTQYPCEWGPAGGVHTLDYYGPRWKKVSAVLKGLSDGMIEVDPSIRKAMGTAGWGHLGAFERMHKDGIQWDISVWHSYGQDPEWGFKALAGYGKPIWVTEFNNPFGSQKGEEQQSEGLRKAMVRLLQLQRTYKVEAAHIYELLDETYWAPDFEAYMGLVRLKGKPGGGWAAGDPKPAYFTVRDLIQGAQTAEPPIVGCTLLDSKDLISSPLRQVTYSFCLMLHRTPSDKDLKGLVGSLESGDTSIEGVLLTILRSPEFSERHSAFTMSDRAYVKAMYLLLLGREADAAGLDSYAAELRDGGLTRAGVAMSLIQSSEFKSKHPVLFRKTAEAGAGSPGLPE
jgi:hypothetical protein